MTSMARSRRGSPWANFTSCSPARSICPRVYWQVTNGIAPISRDGLHLGKHVIARMREVDFDNGAAFSWFRDVYGGTAIAFYGGVIPANTRAESRGAVLL